ncbi:hypothetical protein Plhal304r1_c066g0153901 [Plasmopara halstedii]
MGIGSPNVLCEFAKMRPQRANVAQSRAYFGDYLFSIGSVECNDKSSCVWLVVSGATQHMTYSKAYMKSYKTIFLLNAHLADDGVVQVVKTLDIGMSMTASRRRKQDVLASVWHTPKLSRNLFFVGPGMGVLSKQKRSLEAWGARWQRIVQAVYEANLCERG